ncbi:MAG: hypothetical protein ACKVU1_09535 [bacterium]
MSSLVVRRGLVLAGLAIAALSSCSVPEVETDPTRGSVSGSAPAAGAIAAVDTSASLLDAQGNPLNRKRNASIKTGFGTYIVRNVRFDTGEGFGSDRAMSGFYNGTLWQFELRFVQSIDFVGKIDAEEARTAPENYFVREDFDLRKTFRTWLTKTSGETVEFIVRINSIRGELEEGGPLQLSLEEMETIRRIDFF